MKNSILGKARWLRDVALATSKNNGARVAREWLKYAAMFVMLFIIGIGNVWGETVTYTITSKTAVSTSGTAPAGSSASYSQTYSTAGQATKGNTMTLTLTGFDGCTITGVSISAHNNKSSGNGSGSLTINGQNKGSVTGLSGMGNSGWTTKTFSVTSTVVNSSEDVVVTLSCSTNSLYCQSFTITYTAAPTGTTVTVSPESITFPSAELSGEGASGSATVDMSVTNGSQSSGQYLCAWVESDDEENCEFTIKEGVYSTCSGNATSINDLSVEYYAVSAGTFTGRITVYGYKANEDPVEKVIELSVTITSSCSSAVSIATGSPTNCTINASAASVSTCSGSRQVTISVTPNSCYAAPVKASVTSTGTTATWVSGPTLNADHYDYVYSFAENATGTATFNCSLSTKTTYTVSYNKGTYGTGENSSSTKTCGEDLTLPSSAMFTRDHYTQTGWSTAEAGNTKTYNLGGSYTTDAATTLYPYWEVEKYTVTWSVNGSVTSTTPGVAYNTTTSTPANPSVLGECTGSTFMGWTENSSWASDSAPGDLFNGTTPTITGNITFYAVFADEN